MNNILIEKIKEAKTISLHGHIRPDGDCVGSVLALYNYIKKTQTDKDIKIYLEQPIDKLLYLKSSSDIISTPNETDIVDLAISLDSSDRERLGELGIVFDNAKDTICIDHHITNTHFANEVLLDATASSTCEVLSRYLDFDNIDKDIATCLYTGLIHDTGVFKYSSTTKDTMYLAGKLIDKGVDFGTIIDESFYSKTYNQNKLLAEALLNSKLYFNNQCIVSYIDIDTMAKYDLTSKDMDGIIDQLRNTRGVLVAIFIYELEKNIQKISLRSTHTVDVSKIASYFGGGGHIRASGASFSGDIKSCYKELLPIIENELV